MRVNTYTSIHTHSQAGRTVTAEGPFVVDAVPIHADARGLALVHVCAVAAIWSQDKAWLAHALEAAIFIDTHPVQAHVGRCTFIVVNTVFSICG